MNIAKLMKQAQKVQGDVARVQEEVAKLERSFSVGGGAVTAVASGDGKVKQVKIAPTLLNPAEVDMLEDMVLSAINGALDDVRKEANERLSAVTAGLNLPGLM